MNIVYDGMGMPTKFYYYNVDSNLKYIFIFFGKDSIDYTELNDLMVYSTAYIESTNDLLSKVKDMNGYITTYQYEEFSNSPLIRAIVDLKYYLLSNVVSCNNQTSFERNESKKVVTITESNINNNILYENKKYTIQYFGQTSEVDLITYGIGESINKQVYHYNDLQEIDYTYTHAIDDYNFNYSDTKDGYTFNYNDIRNRINFSQPYIHNYNGEYYSALFDYTTGDSNEYKKYLSNSLSFLTIVQPCESDLEEYIESDNIENYQIGTIQVYHADLVGDVYENEEMIYEIPLYNVNFDKQINYISIPKDYFFKDKVYCLIFNTNRDIKIWFDDILTEGINYCKNYIKENTNGNNNLHEINFNNVTINYNNNGFVSADKLSLQDIKVTKNSCFLNNENYNCWYNDGKNLIYNVNNVIVNKNNINIFSYENSELRSKSYNGIVQREIITSYNSSNNYIQETTTTTNDIYSTTSSTEKYYNQSFQLIREVSSTNVSTYYYYDNNGINIRKCTSSDENIVEKEIEYIKNDVNDQFLFELTNNTYNDKGLNQYKSKYNKEYLLKETINPYFEDTEKFSYINDLLRKIYTGDGLNPNEINKINYDEYGRILQYENNKDKYTFVYGPRDEIIQISLNNNILLEVDYLYESNGTTITKSFNNCVFRYSYDKYNRLITFEKKVDGEFILYLTYCYDYLSTNYFECNPKNKLYSIKMQDKEITFLYNNFNEVIEIHDCGKQSIVNRRFNLESIPGNILNISRELFINESSTNSLFIDSYTTSGYSTDSNQKIENETFIKKELSFGHEMNISVHKEFGRDVYSIRGRDITFYTLKDKYFRITNKSSTRDLSNNMQMLKTVFTYYDNTRSIKNEKITISDYYSSDELNREYSYDKCNNIESIKFKEGNATDKTVNYIYDKYNRIIRENNQILNKTFTYKYDIMGNVISKKSYNYTLNTTLDSLANTEDSFIYFDDEDILDNNNLNRCLIKSFNNKSFIYNEFNQLLQISDNLNDSISFSWHQNLLSSTIKNGNIVTYLYDNLNQRTNKVLSNQNSIEYEYYYDKLVREKRTINGQTKIIIYMYNTNNQIDGFIYDNEFYLYDRNILGDVIHIIKDNQIVAKYVYDAWGNHNVYNPNGTINTNVNFIGNINPIRYRGYYYDVETGLFWLSSRYYSPELGRFIQPADVSTLNPASINGLNLYAYANNNPIGISYSSFGFSGSVGGGLVSSIASSVGGLNFGYSGAVSNSSKWHFDPNFLTEAFGHIQNGFSIIEGAFAGYQNVKHLPQLESLSKISKTLMICGIVLGLAVDAHNNFSNEQLSRKEQTIGFTVDGLYTVGSAALSYGISSLVTAGLALIPGVGLFAVLGGALVSIGVMVFTDWAVEKYGWLDSIKDWIESW